MKFVRNKTRLKGDIYSVIRSLTSLEKISKWTKTIPIEIEKADMQRVDWTLTYDGTHTLMCQFHVMRCAAKTEFCTEVHLLAMVSNDDEVESIDAFSKRLLEALRFNYNKAWVIGDNELNASIFKESF
jgi:hypothetical protein